ncbi:MAG TPA: HEAT repeat domain-containing protein [Chitinophaga sp.]|uniref:HEAT repeat domain-containing protein n=1 Tax=Chitinophaga sp. TaxID=1869181 RepID=UPI002CCE9BDD|nr:HEAT repeat domain-containing protein [Chitinophaga sp.]HVI43823.1 HEAT repeat domain-containing protein [Chitinophaga sp.]
MRIVRNVKLFFREGNSDKTYEIDLCEVGPEQYLVNFRYGKRSGNLKEGTKTTAPVALAAATTIFDALEKEKRSKGYLGEQEAVQDLSFTPVDTTQVADVKHRAILRRLQDALEGKNSYKTSWKTSRVIWKAGELKVKEAVPYVIKLVERGDAMQRYAALWALAKCGDPAAAPVLRSYADNSSYGQHVRMLAANGLLMVLPEAEGKAYAESYFNRLPEVFQEVLRHNNLQGLYQLLQERVQLQVQPEYPVLEDLYILSAGNVMVKQALSYFLAQVPLRPSYFRHIRHIFKQAELLDDQGTVAMLALRFEREAAMFTNPGVRINYDGEEYHPSVFVPHLETYVKPNKELKKPGSSLAYSNKTKRYLHTRVLRHLRNSGELEDMQFVRLATALLLHYRENDATTEYQVRHYAYVNGRYTTVYKQFPANSRAVYLNYILRGNAANLKLSADSREWHFVEPASASNTTLQANPDATKSAEKGNIIKKLFGWLGGEKASNAAATGIPKEYQPDRPMPKPVSEVPFLHLWQKLPQAFIQLLIQGQMEAVHMFAMEQLKAHPDYVAIKAKLDEHAIGGLLKNAFQIPSLFGLELAREQYDPSNPSLPLFFALIKSPLDEARQQGIEWVGHHAARCNSDVDFLMHLIFSPYKDVRDFIRAQLNPSYITADSARALADKAIGELLELDSATAEGNDNLNDACLILERHIGDVLAETTVAVIEKLLQSPVAANHAFAARLLLMKQGRFDFNELSDGVLRNLLNDEYAPVRAAGIKVLHAIAPEELLKRAELLLEFVVATYTDVRKEMRALVQELVQRDNRLAVYFVNELVPRLMRKETAEGIHQDIAAMLSHELVGYLHDVDTATALRLLYSNYRSAQEFGVVVLERYIPAEALTLKQVIAAGSHELQVVRAWCQGFYNKNVARIRYERDAAIGLLDAKWDDTRLFAKEFFRTQFTDNDWSPETLVAIADSVRPDIQAFGREMLMRFFREADGATYLLKLSQHPSVNMQVFATSYLENYAAGNLEFLQQLEHYFRSVLSRVNKARVAKERIFSFLEKEALKSPAAAHYIGEIIAHISATVSIADKARCIEIMRNIRQQYDVELPIIIHETAVRSNIL